VVVVEKDDAVNDFGLRDDLKEEEDLLPECSSLIVTVTNSTTNSTTNDTIPAEPCREAIDPNRLPTETPPSILKDFDYNYKERFEFMIFNVQFYFDVY
jgi:hypothetical protein